MIWRIIIALVLLLAFLVFTFIGATYIGLLIAKQEEERENNNKTE